MLSRNSSITTKLTWMNMLVSAAALLLACTAFGAYEMFTFRQVLVRGLSIQAQIAGSNSVSALVFNDPHSAKATLAALKAAPGIISAEIYTPDGQPFAAYWRDQEGQPPALPEIPAGWREAHWYRSRKLILVRQIRFQGKPVGTVLIQSDLVEMSRRVKGYGLIVATVLTLCLLTAFLFSSMFRRRIAGPILSLAETARTVSRDKNYSVRAIRTRDQDELGFLADSFNEMLDGIQERDAALALARGELERRIEERTAQLTAANKDLESFTYSVSHDLRAPLRQINGFSNILESEHRAQLDAEGQRYLQLIQNSARNMGVLVDDLLKMARLGRQALECKPTDLNSLLESSLDDIRTECKGRQIDWRIGQLPVLECDPVLMRQVFTNLLSNAVKYTRPRPLAVIEAGQEVRDGVRTFFVRDNGAGFDPRYAHKLFGVFQRLHRSEDFEGTGVGLAIVQRIIQKHGGRIWAEGEVDKGATFFFTLDAEARQPENEKAAI